MLVILSVLCFRTSPPYSDPTLDLPAKLPPVGDRRAVGESSEESDSCEGRDASRVKNAVMKVYSAVALSIRTSKRDRNSASTGSFCVP